MLGRKPPLPWRNRRCRPSALHVALILFLIAVVTPLTLSLSATASRATAESAARDVDGARGLDVENDVAAQRRVAARFSVSRSAGRGSADASAPGGETVPTHVDVAAQAQRDRHRAPDAGVPPRAGPDVLAQAGDVELLVPAAHDVEAVVGFHQASGNGAVVLAPAGRTLDSAVAGFEPLDDERGHDHHVLASRGRGTAATSAVDVALAEGTQVLAPVTGVVETVADYALYGRVSDTKITIVSEADPDVAVHVLHVQDPVVEEGQRVEAGVTPLATVRLLPFGSQIDRITRESGPHTHLEVRPR